MFWSGSVRRLIAFFISPQKRWKFADVVPGRRRAGIRPDEMDLERRLARRLRDVREVGRGRGPGGGRVPALAGLETVEARRVPLFFSGG